MKKLTFEQKIEIIREITAIENEEALRELRYLDDRFPQRFQFAKCTAQAYEDCLCILLNDEYALERADAHRIEVGGHSC